MTDGRRSRARRILRAAAAVAGVVILLAGIGAAASADARFVLRAGYEEVRLLLRRRPLDDLIANPATPAVRRDLFQLVLQARSFGQDSLGLSVGKTYTSFVDVGRDTLVLVLSASPRLELSEHTWWFPVVGEVPYHGYFSLSAARREIRRLEVQGYDTYLRPAGAFSTLGWFGDPIFSTALFRDSTDLVETVLHEVTHNTVWARGSVSFNESFANFVGHRGAELFFRERGDTALANRTARRWEDEKQLAEFYAGLAGSLDSVYRSAADSGAKLAGREAVFQRARQTIDGPLRRALKVYSADRLLEQPLNNAIVVAARFYRTRLELFDRVLRVKDGDLRETIRAIVAVVKTDDDGDPFGTIEELTPVVR